jgi:acetyl esterase/lipase
VVNIQQWAKDGFFVMRIDYRLVTCTPAPACFQDVACAIRWIHAHASTYKINVDQVFLLGQSCGGHLVSLGATLGFDAFDRTGGWETYAPNFTAGICVSGGYDLLTLDWGSGWSPPGVAWDKARAFASPIQHASKASKPLLLLHAEGDTSVPIEQADAFAKKLQAAGAKFEYKRFATGGHLKFSPVVVEASREFIRKHTKRFW